MRTLSLLVPLLLATAPLAAQGIVIPVRCHGTCPPESLPRTLALESVGVWASLERGSARTSVTHVFRNPGANVMDAAFFFPLPEDAVIQRVSVVNADVPAHDNSGLVLYNEWSLPDESRWIAEGLARDRGVSGLREYTRARLVHVPVREIPPGGTRRLQLQYTQPLRTDEGPVAYGYPLSVGSAVAPIRRLDLGVTIKTDAGFADVGSPSHAVQLELGTEAGPCHPRAACGSRGYPSERVRVVRLEPGADDRRRDFRLIYTPNGGPPRPDLIRIPWRDNPDADRDPGDALPSPR